VKQRLLELPAARASTVRRLAEQAAQSQRDRFLSLFSIEKGKVPQLTGSDIAMLASHGIDSADDVLRRTVDLPKLILWTKAHELEAWAREQANKFSFDPARGLDADEVREVDQLMLAQQEQHLDTLKQGEKQLWTLSQEMELKREGMRRELDRARNRLAEAEKEAS
jgi:DNA-binding helix-hairpin-helix protein with protein kinase domain